MDEAIETTQAKEMILAAEALLQKGDKFAVIVTEGEASLAAEYRARVNQQIKDLDAERLEMGAGIRATLQRINDKFNVPINGLKDKLEKVDKALKGYLQVQRDLAAAAEKARREQEAQRQREIEERRQQEIQRQKEIEEARRAAEIANLPPPPEPEPLPPEPEPLPAYNMPEPVNHIRGSFGSSLGTRGQWKYEVENIKKVPEQFLVPVEDRVNKSALNAMARSMKENAKVPGIRFYEEETLQSRVKT